MGTTHFTEDYARLEARPWTHTCLTSEMLLGRKVGTLPRRACGGSRTTPAKVVINITPLHHTSYNQSLSREVIHPRHDAKRQTEGRMPSLPVGGGRCLSRTANIRPDPRKNARSYQPLQNVYRSFMKYVKPDFTSLRRKLTRDLPSWGRNQRRPEHPLAKSHLWRQRPTAVPHNQELPGKDATGSPLQPKREKVSLGIKEIVVQPEGAPPDLHQEFGLSNKASYPRRTNGKNYVAAFQMFAGNVGGGEGGCLAGILVEGPLHETAAKAQALWNCQNRGQWRPNPINRPSARTSDAGGTRWKLSCAGLLESGTQRKGQLNVVSRKQGLSAFYEGDKTCYSVCKNYEAVCHLLISAVPRRMPTGIFLPTSSSEGPGGPFRLTPASWRPGAESTTCWRTTTTRGWPSGRFGTCFRNGPPDGTALHPHFKLGVVGYLRDGLKGNIRGGSQGGMTKGATDEGRDAQRRPGRTCLIKGTKLHPPPPPRRWGGLQHRSDIPAQEVIPDGRPLREAGLRKENLHLLRGEEAVLGGSLL
ncbi:hypothetical protein GWK47_025740 [Chionoecetes opilio]|uniref:Uncharacterized protein n=1 Tax=Chionoecetes opilio TaxID=41210 RepID=A0A8J8WF39_CHIOP|nr:hypothetical protein GWK47_025740 [Chionoecetes opilio]